MNGFMVQAIMALNNGIFEHSRSKRSHEGVYSAANGMLGPVLSGLHPWCGQVG